MNRTRKIFPGILAALVVLSLGGAAVGFLWVRSTGLTLLGRLPDSPEQAAQVVRAIAELTLPVGFGASRAAQLAGFSLAGYTGGDGRSHIYLVQVPGYASLDQAEMERQLQAAIAADDLDRTERLEVVERRKVTIRGQSVTLVISEGTSAEGTVYRVANGMFQGKSGRALVNLSVPAEQWDASMVEAFLGSLR